MSKRSQRIRMQGNISCKDGHEDRAKQGSETEDIKKGTEHTENQRNKKMLNQDNHDRDPFFNEHPGMQSQWVLGSTTMKKADGDSESI